MGVIIAKWGNGLGLHIPQYVAKEIGLESGTPVDIKIVDGAIVVKPRAYTLKELLNQVTPENLHREINTGERSGNEEW
ncbi:MAG TPA: AbrB/MazE/SpoVT family DNA-binding domain-containing protein [Desulfosporosinus sp.]|nr:AbrB/MazE/SpoVT family DNA-binding domain-containing protein [Desulfosporosinus sp.]